VLPHAPRLRRFFFDDIAIKWTFHNQTTAKITTVSIWTHNWSAQSLCAFLRQVAETITTLTLISNGYNAYPTGEVVVLPNLIRLTLRFPEWLVHIRVLNLDQLELAWCDLEPSSEPLLEYLSCIKTLVLWEEHFIPEPRCVQELGRVFTNLTHLKFAVPSEYYAMYGRGALSAVPKTFLGMLAGVDSAPPVWPCLQRISFGNDADPLPQRIDVDVQSLAAMMRRRQCPTGGTVPLRLHVAPAVELKELRDLVEQLMCTETEG